MSGQAPLTVARDGGNPFLKFVGHLSTTCGIAAAFMIVAAIFITCEMIFVRYVLNHSTIWQTEMVVYLMVGATMIGLPYVQRLRGHVNVDLLPLMLPPLLRRLLAFVTLIASILMIGLMLWYGFDLWHVAWSKGWKSDTVWGVRLWIPYLALPVGFTVYLLQLCADLFAVARGIEQPFGLEGDV